VLPFGNLYSPSTGKASKKEKKELNYILTKVDAILIQILMFKVAQS